LMSLALGWVGEPAIAELTEPPVEDLLGSVLGSLSVTQDLALVISHAVGVAISFFIITSLHIVLGEQSAKMLALQAPERHALFVVRPLSLFAQVFRPVIRFLDWATDRVLGLLGIPETNEQAKIHSADELRLLVEESAEAGVL